jgi:pimeloyl-ACP methyl ester carboxylesterase/DNA-binding CsgD family transcriptional regulator
VHGATLDPRGGGVFARSGHHEANGRGRPSKGRGTLASVAAEPFDQEIRFCATPGGQIAYASVGSGPVLVLPALWISHLELEWGFPELRSFISALAAGRRVVRYDRLGTGLSDRSTQAPAPSVEAEVETLEALVSELGIEELDLLGISFGGCTAVAFTARHPEWVRRLALFGAYGRGADIAPRPLQEALVATVRAHWGAGSRALADVWVPGANTATRAKFAALQRESATAEMAAATLAAVYEADITEALAAVPVPALVAHRRRDRAIPFACGRELAALLPEGRLHALAGDVHPPWLGDRGSVVRTIAQFLDQAPDSEQPLAAVPAQPATASPLSEREAEILRLVADGLTNPQIAERLIVSTHTVHRHVANIRLKLDQPSRAAAATYALRHGLI